METKLKVLNVTGGSAGQLIRFSIVDPDPEATATRLVKERDSNLVELFVKNPNHGLEEGQVFTFSIDLEQEASEPIVAAPSVPAVATPPAPTPVQLAEEKLAEDAKELTALKQAEAIPANNVPQPPPPALAQTPAPETAAS